MDWHWFLRTIAKSAALGVPAVATLAFWLSRGVTSRTFYRVTWANPIGHILWLTLIVVMGRINESPTLRGWIPSSLPGNVFFAFPLLFAFASLVLCSAAIFLKSSQRRFAVCANALMLILWLSVVVAPN